MEEPEELDSEEIKVFIGILIYMGIHYQNLI